MRKKHRRGKPPSAESADIEIRNHANGRLDEIVTRKADVHLEQMDSGFWWMCLEVGDRSFHVNFVSAKGIRVTVDEEESGSLRPFRV
jgi:hypothetical protein